MSVDNLQLYESVRKVPDNAQREIRGGRLNGKTDINPMWRIKELTNQFGPCGIGWKYVITKQWLETGGKDEVAAFVNIDLYIKHQGEWSEAIPGTGGSMFVALENQSVYENGVKVRTEKAPYTSDECYKMALTDAISVACKALGFGADIYWSGDKTKYDKPQEQNTSGIITESQQKRLYAISKGKEDVAKKVLASFGYQHSTQIKIEHYNDICDMIQAS